MKAVTSLALIIVLCTGCYRMTITNGREPVQTPVVDDRWRSTTVLDVVDIEPAMQLDGQCKESQSGWAKIEQRRTAVNWLVDVFLAGFVYESTRASLYCAKTVPAPR